MGKPSKQNIEDLRALTKLVINATTGTTELVEAMHSTIELAHPPLGKSQAGATKGIAGLVYRSIRGGTKLVGDSLDIALQNIAPLLEDKVQPSPSRDKFLSVINGVFGDSLAEQDNSLALEMRFIYQQKQLQLNPINTRIQEPSSKLMLFIHGLCMSHHGWQDEAKNLSGDMAEQLGFTPVYLHYNTGQSIASNGATLADQLERLVNNWPTAITNLTIIGHSMGGLLARSAYYHGEQARHGWLTINKALVSIGAPHNGALLEKGGAVLDKLMQLSPYALPFTRITKTRSQGIEDLRCGTITKSDETFIPLPAGVKFYALAAVLNKQANGISEQTIGDGLVTLDSAFGHSKNTNRCLSIPEQHKWLGYDLGHNEMLCSAAVFTQIQQWLG